jgi:hypothetical protein
MLAAGGLGFRSVVAVAGGSGGVTEAAPVVAHEHNTPASSPRELRKRLQPLVDYVASAA